jgi:hypothetical protein
MVSSEFKNYTKNVKTAANFLDSLLLNPVKREINKLQITNMFGQLRNDANEYLKTFKLKVDELLSDMEKEEVVDLLLINKIVSFGFKSKFSEAVEDQDNNQLTIQFLEKFLTDFVRTWKYFENPKPYYRLPDRPHQRF